ncbi:TATA-box binding [Thalassobacillus cyri]|uniref:TATA-box binding n=1 Tax=Thalassobacillus cyri TaxID=571932 RepID=A0A1H4D842_9BACI|nr:YwmB family TATA-box binding protein [Thalassobacillus cyri]SEA68861.1 TATA-box binding [Thalassobacillus cyri]
MRSLLIILVAILMLSTDLETFAGVKNKEELPLGMIAAQLQSQGIEADGWEVIAKESFSRQHLDMIKGLVEEEVPQAQWQRASDRNSEKYSIVYPQKATGITETFIVIVPKKHRNYIEVIYKITGTSWGEASERFLKNNFFVEKDRIFSENVAIFSCIEAEINGIIDDVLVYKNLVQALDIKTIEMIDETDFKSISGYTPEWEQTIPLPAGAMNVQFAVRKGLGAKTNITIGTPIITSEY